MTKIWLRFYSYEKTTGNLRMLIRGIEYAWDYVSSQFVKEIQGDLNKHYHQGHILKRIENFYGEGKKIHGQLLTA